jgi:hypothetical protein
MAIGVDVSHFHFGAAVDAPTRVLRNRTARPASRRPCAAAAVGASILSYTSVDWLYLSFAIGIFLISFEASLSAFQFFTFSFHLSSFHLQIGYVYVARMVKILHSALLLTGMLNRYPTLPSQAPSLLFFASASLKLLLTTSHHSLFFRISGILCQRQQWHLFERDRRRACALHL